MSVSRMARGSAGAASALIPRYAATRLRLAAGLLLTRNAASLDPLDRLPELVADATAALEQFP